MLTSKHFSYRFCSTSKYANLEKLDHEMKLLNQTDKDPLSSVTNFRDIKTYLGSHPEDKITQPQLGNISLQDIKGHFEAENRRFDDIQKQALRKKEQELADEV